MLSKRTCRVREGHEVLPVTHAFCVDALVHKRLESERALERERDVRVLLDVTARRETVPTMCTSNRGAWGRSGGPRSIHLRSTIKLPRPNAERELLYEEERVVRTMARCTSGTVRELALLDGVAHSARSPVCLIKHHAGCWGVRVLVTERAVCVAVVVVRAAGLVLRNQLESRVRPCVRCAQRPARLILVEKNSDLDVMTQV